MINAKVEEQLIKHVHPSAQEVSGRRRNRGEGHLVQVASSSDTAQHVGVVDFADSMGEHGTAWGWEAWKDAQQSWEEEDKRQEVVGACKLQEEASVPFQVRT